MMGAMPEAQSNKARLFEGHSQEHEGWEYQTYFIYGATVVILGAMEMFKPDTTIQTVRLKNLVPSPIAPVSTAIV